MMEASRILVLGLGNILFQDEGLGVRAVEQLRAQHPLPETVEPLDGGMLAVEFLDGGTLGLDLLAYFSRGTRMLILDAVRSGQAAGQLIRLEGSAIPAALAQKMSMHQLGLQDLLAASTLRGTLPDQVVLWGVEPAQIDWGMDLSPSVAGALPGLVEAAASELRSWGVAL